ncbi:MAG: phosphonate ABC transporter, permease protein PhnE [Candidatus Limnocylindria bacterium]
MVAAPAAAPSGRPATPRTSLTVPIGIAAAIALTAWSVVGTGLHRGEIWSIAQAGVIFQELLQPNWGFAPRTFDAMLETIQMAVIATTIGCAIALPVSFLASRVTAPSQIVLLFDRSVLNVIRALPDLLYAMVFVAALSIGPLPGILALIFFSIGVVAKLLSETVDGIDVGPLEAARAAGADRVQTVWTAALPQVLPHYVAYSLYAFELNIRASAIIGIVGAGGIGNVLNTQRKFFNYENVSIVIVELFLLVFVIEVVSIWLRRRLV